MARERIIEIEDVVLGTLDGRDCVYIDKVTLDSGDSLTFEGEINGLLASKIRRDVWVPYKLVFRRVIAQFSCELDTYIRLNGMEYLEHSDFSVIKNSGTLEKFPIRGDLDRSVYKHFRVFTYDVVFDIFAVSFEMAADLYKIKGFDNGSLGLPVDG